MILQCKKTKDVFRCQKSLRGKILIQLYLESIFSYLRRAGIVVGTVGALEGYTLSKSAFEMNLYDILKLLEGELSMTGSEQLEVETDLRRFLRKEVWDVIDKNIKYELKK